MLCSDYKICNCNGLQESKKWQERKEALDALQKLAESPKIEPADYNELMRILKKVIFLSLAADVC